MSTISNKLLYSGIGTLVLLSVANNKTYSIVNNLLSSTNNKNLIAVDGCPTSYGHLVHTIVFFLLLLLIKILMNLGRNQGDKKTISLLIKYTFYCTLLFYFFTNKEIYQITGHLTNGKLSDINGCPTFVGLLVHALLFMFTAFALMFLPKDK